MYSVEKKIEKIFDAWFDKHTYADFHGIAVDHLYNSLITLGRQVDKKFKEGFGEEHING